MALSGGGAAPASAAAVRTADSSGCPGGSCPLANAPPVHVSLTGCSASHGCPAQITASLPSNAAMAASTGSPSRPPSPPSRAQPVGHRAGPVTAPQPADGEPERIAHPVEPGIGPDLPLRL